MADQIEINIYLKQDESSPKSEDGVTGTGGDVKGMSQADKDAKKSEKAWGALGKYIASQTVEVFIGNVKGSISQNIALVTGKTELQQKIDFGMEVAQQGINTYKNAMAGATVFSTAGLSSGVGAVIGVALSVISYGINVAFKTTSLNASESLENKQISQTLSRNGAGYNKSRSGL